ncbi:ATP-binding protein [Streptomyces erythrochromogenes]
MGSITGPPFGIEAHYGRLPAYAEEAVKRAAVGRPLTAERDHPCRRSPSGARGLPPDQAGSPRACHADARNTRPPYQPGRASARGRATAIRCRTCLHSADCGAVSVREAGHPPDRHAAEEEQVTTTVLDQSLSRTGWPGAAAREATRAFLARAARLRAPAKDVSMDDVLLVVAELVANAIRHTDGPSSLHLELLDDAVDVCVADPSPRPPQPRTPRTDGTGGWGWFMVQRLATHIRIRPAAGGGKIICAELPW